MKKYLSIVAIFSCLLLGIPSVVLLKSAAYSPKPSKTTSSSPQSATATATSNTPAKTVPITDTYLVLDITTGEVTEISVRDYIIGSVCAEMPATFHEEALKAQAIASHTYAERQKSESLKILPPNLAVHTSQTIAVNIRHTSLKTRLNNSMGIIMIYIIAKSQQLLMKS